jgi:hypothetical protein
MLRKWATFCLVLLAISFVGLRQYYTRERPAIAQPMLGRVVPVELNYNKTVYVTRSEERLLFVTGEVPLILVIASIWAINNRAIIRKSHVP